MRIVTLIENLVYQQGLLAEHGLSIYIETENSKILLIPDKAAFSFKTHKRWVSMWKRLTHWYCRTAITTTPVVFYLFSKKTPRPKCTLRKVFLHQNTAANYGLLEHPQIMLFIKKELFTWKVSLK